MDQVIFHVDFEPVRAHLQKALSVYSQEVQRRATYNALNAVGDPLRTAVRRLVRDQTGAKYGRVVKAITAKRAHPNNLSYTIRARDTAMKLSDFGRGLKPGQQNPLATPWNQSRRFKGAFVVSFGGTMEIVKRVAHHARSRGPGHKLGVKLMYGPIIPREMLRENKPSLQEIANVVPRKLVPRLMHELEQAQIRAKAASGT